MGDDGDATGTVKSWTWLKGTRWVSTWLLLAHTSTVTFWDEESELSDCPTEKATSEKEFFSRSSSVFALPVEQPEMVLAMPCTCARPATS